MTNAFLIFSLLFPRPTLLLCWLWLGLPANDTPFALDVVAALFAPRLLLAWWAYQAHVHPLWVAMFLLFALVRSRGAGRRAQSWAETKEKA